MAWSDSNQSPSPARSSLQLPGVDGPSPYLSPWRTWDPRTSSTQSLVPSRTEREDERRTLLVIYLHGFMGNDSSFRSFPAHVHNYLREALAESHVIHTKIYPRYKTYKAIEVARDNFSQWLAPHESPTTDVILVGHSMGGLLAAEIALLPAVPGSSDTWPFRHRILGTVSLDAPLLGLHPGIVVSGIASLFRPAPSPPPQSENTVFPDPSCWPSPDAHQIPSPASGAASPPLDGTSSPPPDPFFNPPFFNDISFVDRGWVKNIAHFANKHRSKNLIGATASHLLSHLEFGGCLADYPGLRVRYNRLRMLEDVDEFNQHPSMNGQSLVRVRFVNYYTISSGIVKSPPKSEKSPDRAQLKLPDVRKSTERQSLDVPSGISTPRISVEDYSDGARSQVQELLRLDPTPDTEPLSDGEPGLVNDTAQSQPLEPIVETTDNGVLPPIPPIPSPPALPDLDAISDKESRKQAEKEAKRSLKAYEQALKAREKAIREHDKAVEKQRRKTAKDAEKQAKQEQKRLQKEEKERERNRLQKEAPRASPPPPPPRRKFCMLPSKSASTGARDPTWVEVFMEGVDEVGAHCGLFLPGPHYEKLVGDVGERIAGWVREDASRRVILQLTAGNTT